MEYLNLGCGIRLHPDWTNVDVARTAPGVIAADLTRGVPFPDDRFDVVYHSHVLEHFPREQGERFVRECFRVLKPDGVVRVAVPDLEQIARAYLRKLEDVSAGKSAAEDDYDWVMLEMYDQTVRDTPGGGTAQYLYREHIPNERFVLERMGVHSKLLIEAGRRSRSGANPPRGGKSLLAWRLGQFRRYPYFLREAALRVLLGRDYAHLRAGRFRAGGEVHQWMYDRWSLRRLLERCGFEGVERRGASDSYVPDWPRFNLDTEPDGAVYKADSLFMEGRKPRRHGPASD